MTLDRQPPGSAVALVPPTVPAVVVPASVPDVIYPETDGEPLAEGTDQYFALTDTVAKLHGRYLARPDVAVIGNMLLYYEKGNPRASVAPDVFVVFGVADRSRSSYLLWEEGKVPDFVLEVASDSTQREDAGRKRDLYARLGVAEYWRFDPTPDSHLLQPPLIGERWEAGISAEIPVQRPGAREWRGYSKVLALEFRAASGQLQLFDPETGTFLLDYRAQHTALQSAREEAQSAREEAQSAQRQVQSVTERAQSVEARNKLLEAEIRRLRNAKSSIV